MLELIAAFVGLAVASAWDLRTTEVPDELPALMIAAGIFYWFVAALATGDFAPLFYSLALGTTALAFGLILYRRGSWGGADAWLLGAVGYLVPVYSRGLFMPDYIFNLFFAGAGYTILYALALGMMNRHVFPHFWHALRKRALYVLSPLLLLLPVHVLAVHGVNTAPLLAITALLQFLAVFWVYARTVEQRVFRRRVHVSKLRVGDVLEDSIWKGASHGEIAALRKKKRYVIVKEGVRFVPAFLLALVATLLYGNLMMYLLF